MSNAVATFHVCGSLVETYECSASSPRQEDLQEIQRIKQDLLRNFGYAPIVYIEHGK